MWDVIEARTGEHLSHDLPCTGCGHGQHTYLPCSDSCTCAGSSLPGAVTSRR